MSKMLTPVAVDLTKEALLRVFWYKQSLRLFLQQHGIGEAMLAKWQPEQSKREFVEWLWSRLVLNDSGQGIMLAIARSLSEMRAFPDLERKEDTKQQIAAATQAVARIREQVARIDQSGRESENATQRRRAAQDELVQRRAAQQSIENLERDLNNLTPQIGTQDGGYGFENWFYDLAVFFELQARPGYITDGRQIDGAVTIEGTTYLVETKFTKGPTEAPDIDVFMAKIEDKADNTMGLLISIAGFTDGAVRAASKQRTPMLLLDHSHLFGLILRGVMSLSEVVSRIKRHASQTGSAFLPAAEF